MKKIILISSLVVVIVVSTLIFLLYNLKNNKKVVKKPEELKMLYSLIGEKEITINVFEEYVESGVTFLVGKKDVTNEIKILGKVDNTKLGKYKLEYSYNEKVYLTRIINVIDNVSPEISLNGEKEITLIETTKYLEKGIKAIDNYDGDISEKVTITSDINTNKVGTYKIIYNIVDSSNNKSVVERIVKVIKKPIKIVEKTVPVVEEKYIPPVEVKNDKINSKVEFSTNGFIFKRCGNQLDEYKVISINEVNYELSKKDNCYEVEININNFANGNYELYLNKEQKTKIKDERDNLLRIKRTRIGNKLLTFNYVDDFISFSIEDFSYDYDVIIDVGHGGFDTGATNIFIEEKTMNLEVSLYEKSKLEEAGLKVLLTRTNDTYGSVMGNNTKPLYNRAYYLGYYGVRSKVIYSNHHNASISTKRGFEIYTSNAMKDLATEIKIFNDVSKIMTTNNIYGRDYDSERMLTKTSGQVYSNKNYYAIMRIPQELFNLNNVVMYEGCYISNVDEFIKYWEEENWKKISDLKVKYYIEKIKAIN